MKINSLASILTLLFAFGAQSFAVPPSPGVSLTASDQQKITRAVILAEKFARSGFHSNRTLPGLMVEPMGPLNAQEALGACGDTQHFLSYILQLEGISGDHLHFYQMMDGSNSSYEGTGPAFLGRRAAAHAVLVYDTVSTDGQPLHLFLDITFPQFTESVLAMKSDPVGKILLDEIHQFGFWVGTRESISTYAAFFKSNSGVTPFLDAEHHPIDFSSLNQDYPARDSAQHQLVLRLGKMHGSSDTEMLKAI